MKNVIKVALLTALLYVSTAPAFALSSRFYQGVAGNPLGFEIDGNYFTNGNQDWSDNVGSANVLKRDASNNAIPGVNIINSQQVARWNVDRNWGCTGCVDSSQFDGTSNKNGDDIGAGTNNWTYSINGQGPQKNDLTNVMMFLKRNTTETWLIGGCETRAANGDSHLDFEFNQRGVKLVGSSTFGYIKGNGTSGGRTAGDFIVSIDYENGGSNPLFSFRVWNGTTASWNIVNLTPQVDYYFAANDRSISAVSPTGGVSTGGDPTGTTTKFQFVEFALKSSVINQLFTSAYACDTNATVTVKTRSSQSFTAELKDFLIMPFLPNVPPQVSCTDQCACQIPAGNNFTVSNGPAAVSGYNYLWKIKPGSASATLTSVIIASPTAHTTTVSTLGYGSVQLVLVVQNGQCVDSCTSTIEVKRTPSCTINPVSGPVCSNSTTTITAAVTPSTATYAWSVTGNGSIQGSSTGTSVQVLSGAGAGTFSVNLVVSLPGCNGGTCTSSCSVTVDVTPCVRYCTYTQGAYGNAGGTHCNGQTTPAFVTGLLSTPLVVGAGTKTVTFNSSDVNCLIAELPAGGTAGVLGGSYTCATVQPINNGKIYNILLGQTITLGLNMRINGGILSNLALTGRYLRTASGSGTGCSSIGTAVGSGQVWALPQSVITYLGVNNKVSDLFALANNALGGVYVPSGSNPSLSEINNAVDIINNAFDGCKILVSISNIAPRISNHVVAENVIDNLPVLVYPNPFSEQLAVRVELSERTRISIELFSLDGRKAAEIYNGDSGEDMVRTFIANTSLLAPGTYVCKVVAGDRIHVERIVMVR